MGGKTMRPSKTVIGLAILAGAFLFWPAGEAVFGQAQAKQLTKAVPKTRDVKIADFLKVIERAQSMEEIANAFESMKFSTADHQRIEEEIKKGGHVRKLETLTGSAQAAAAAKAESEIRQKTRQMELQLERDAEKKIQRSRQEAQILVKNAEQLRSRTVYQKKTASPAPVSRAKVQTPASGSLSRITSFDPQPVSLQGANDLYIMGANFGRGPGQVRITTGGAATVLRVISWHDNSIIVRLPANLLDIVRDAIPDAFRGGEIEGRVSVETSGNIASGSVRLHAPPDLSRLQPRITSVSPEEVSPRHVLVLHGTNFLEDAGRVTFLMGSERFPGRIEKWYDGLVSVVVPEIKGFLAMDGRVEIETKLGLRTQSVFKFQPALERRGLLTNYGNGGWLGPCMFGCTEVVTWHSFVLQNGFVIKDVELRARGAHTDYRTRPRVGTTFPRTVLEIRVPAFTFIYLSHFIFIEGPAGVRWDRPHR